MKVNPLHSLTRKNVEFKWEGAAEASFELLKTMLTTAPVLAYPWLGSGRDFISETDASVVGLGAVLSQEQKDGLPHPIAYASPSLNQYEKNYGISELETLGLVWAVGYFRCYLLGHYCTLYTDHTACFLLILKTSI